MIRPAERFTVNIAARPRPRSCGVTRRWRWSMPPVLVAGRHCSALGIGGLILPAGCCRPERAP